MDWQEARDTLRKLREDNTRCSTEIVRIWEEVLEDYAGKLGTERWLALEQVFIAALDCGRMQLADKCLKALKDQFPSSLRIKRLTGMKLEALGRYEQAMDLYDSIIKADETHAQARKRKVAILKAQKRNAEAIQELSDYLKLFMGDQEAWLELCDLYINDGEYGRAAFCLEEVILLNPHCHFYHQKYAEIRYTMGGMENLELARSYFCQAVKLKDDNVRALYGLLLTCGQLAASPKLTAPKKKECFRLVRWAGERLKEVYSGEDSDSSAMPSDSLTDLPASIASPDLTNGSSSSKNKKKPSTSAVAVVKATGDAGKDAVDVEAVEGLIGALALLPVPSS